MKQTPSLSLALSLLSCLNTADAFWRMNCDIAQVGRVDPLVNPNAISGHVHMLSGAINVNTTSTFDSLTAASCTTCSIQKDLSAYWTPLLYYQKGDGSFVNVPTDGTVVYYLGRGEDRFNIVPFPRGFQVLSGDSSARSYDSNTLTYGNGQFQPRPVSDRVSFACIDYNHPTPETPNITNTNCPNGLRAQLHFPSCWDGVNLYKTDQSHVAYMSQIDNGICPPTHPKLLPHLFYEIYYYPDRVDTSDGGRFVFSNGDATGFGFHGDFINGWDNDVLTAAIDQCINDVESGNISECPPLFASEDDQFGVNCPERPPIVNEQVKGNLPKLPGCNEVTTGPERAPQGVCPTQPELNPIENTDGQGREIPVPDETTLDLESGAKALYKGCYQDATNGRALSLATFASDTMSGAACGAFCQSKGFTVFGTEYARECYCGNEITTPVTPQGDCSMLCAGERTEFCGGPARLSVWTITDAPSPGTSSSTTATTSSATGSATISSSSTSSTSTSTSSSSPSAPTPVVPNSSYLGCYSDNTGGRTLTDKLVTDPQMTLELCAQQAQSLNLKYFGVEYAGECFLGYKIGASATTIDEAKCSMACKGNGTQVCGGPDALSMFENKLFVAPANPSLVPAGDSTSAQYAYQGCFREGTSGRALGGSGSNAYSTTSDSMTVEDCVATCHARGFSFAGVEYARECYCNNDGIVNGGGAAPGGDADCNMLCAGSKAEWCGGPSRVSVYQLQTGAAAMLRRNLHYARRWATFW